MHAGRLRMSATLVNCSGNQVTIAIRPLRKYGHPARLPYPVMPSETILIAGRTEWPTAHGHGDETNVDAMTEAGAPQSCSGESSSRAWRASAMRLRAQRREVLPNMAASLRSDRGLPVSMLVR